VFVFVFSSEQRGDGRHTQAWNKDKLHHKALNVLHMIQKWNETSMWVTSLILEPVKVKYRAKRWESLIKIAKVPSSDCLSLTTQRLQAASDLVVVDVAQQHVERMNNFNTLMAMVSGMNNACVSRLKWTKALMSRKSVEVSPLPFLCFPLLRTGAYSVLAGRRWSDWKR
jgi:hypothetical protein